MELLQALLTKNSEDRITIPEIRKHPWITKSGEWPMPKVEKELIFASDSDKKNAFGKVNIIGSVLLKKLSQVECGS